MEQLIDLLNQTRPFYTVSIVYLRTISTLQTLINYFNGEMLPNIFEHPEKSYIRHLGTETYTQLQKGCNSLYRVDVTMALVASLGVECVVANDSCSSEDLPIIPNDELTANEVVQNFINLTSKVAVVRSVITDQQLIRSQENIKSEYPLVKINFVYTFYTGTNGSDCIIC